jgi:outer membrane protein OmpA-like peptidoglycan-associated protein
MKTALSRVVCTIGLVGVSAAALAGDGKKAPAQEPVGFITGAVIGGFAAGPVGAVVGAGLGTWLGNRVHRAGEAGKAEAQVAQLQTMSQGLETEKTALLTEKSALIAQQANLAAANQSLAAKLDEMSAKAETVRATPDDASDVLDGLQGDVLFRTGSAEITPDIAHQIQVIAQAVTKSPSLKVRLDGYADPRGGAEINMKLSQDRANAVRDLLLAAGVAGDALEVNAYGKTQSVASDSDGYALERRVRLTLQMDGAPAVAQTGPNRTDPSQ